MQYTNEKDIIFSDQPWAVAWYADRHSIWTPKRVEEFEMLEQLALDQRLDVAGIITSPTSFEKNPLYKRAPFHTMDDFAAMQLDGTVSGAIGARPGYLVVQTPALSEISARYSYNIPLFPGRITYFSSKPPIGQ